MEEEYPVITLVEVWDGMDEGTLSKTKKMLDDMHKRKIEVHGKEVKYLEERSLWRREQLLYATGSILE